MNQVKFMENLGKVATVTAVAMYVSYFPQIMHNLAHPGTGDWIQPLSSCNQLYIMGSVWFV